MDDALTIIAVTSGAFIGTNLDNLILLVALYSRYLNKSKTVTAGYLGGMVIIGAITFLVGVGGDFIPVNYLAALGVIPIFLGVLALVQLFRTPAELNGNPILPWENFSARTNFSFAWSLD